MKHQRTNTKTLLRVLLSLAMLFALAGPVWAVTIEELPQVRITVNDKALSLDPQNPAIKVTTSNGARILVPMRIIFESLGATVDWDDSSQTINASADGYQVVMRIGNNAVTINGSDTYIDIPPTLYSKRTYVPVRIAGEALGATVNYDDVTGNVAILKSGVTPPQDPGPTQPSEPVTQPSTPSVLPGNLKTMSLTAGFSNGTAMPLKHQSDMVDNGQNVSPGVSWTSFSGAQSYAIGLFDTHSDAEGYVHWLVTVPGATTRIPENASGSDTYPEDCEEITMYEGPALDEEDGRHDYELRIVALNVAEPDLSSVVDLADFEATVASMALAQGKVSTFVNYGKQLTPAPARPANLNVTSAAMSSSGIPIKYTQSFTDTMDGEGYSIPVSWSNGPSGTLSYALVFMDTSADLENYVHWMVAGLPTNVTSIRENASDEYLLPEDCEELVYYDPPILDEDDGRHSFKLIVVALNDDLEGLDDLSSASSYEEFEEAIQGHVLARGELTSFFHLQ